MHFGWRLTCRHDALHSDNSCTNGGGLMACLLLCVLFWTHLSDHCGGKCSFPFEACILLAASIDDGGCLLAHACQRKQLPALSQPPVIFSMFFSQRSHVGSLCVRTCMRVFVIGCVPDFLCFFLAKVRSEEFCTVFYTCCGWRLCILLGGRSIHN